MQIPPIVLHHGLLGGEHRGMRLTPAGFKGVDLALAKLGCPVFLSSVHPTAGIETRARQLQKWILALVRKIGAQKIILMAHSLGGLDARYMLWRLDAAEHIDALVTISTPHRGSPYADWCTENLGKKLRGFEIFRRFGWDTEAIADLTTERCARFNEKIQNAPGVRYFSISTSRSIRQMPAWSLHSWTLVHRAEGANDGLVSVQSAKWGKHLETWPVDHWHAINHRMSLAARKDGDISPRYCQLVREICGRKPETRSPKPEIRIKSQTRMTKPGVYWGIGSLGLDSPFGLLVSGFLTGHFPAFVGRTL
jgi:triacylglycerol lipase